MGISIKISKTKTLKFPKMLMMPVECIQVISIVHAHVTQYLSNVDLINFKIALPKDYDFYLEDTVLAKILTNMLGRKGISVCPHCVDLIDMPKSQHFELVQSFHEIIQEIVCCYDHDTFLSHLSPNIYYAKHSEQKQIFNYVENKLSIGGIHLISPSFAEMIGKIEQLEQENDELVFVHFSSDRKAFITLPANISCEWCTNCDEGHYNTVISMSGDKNNFFCRCCGISFCCCNEDYIICSSCGSISCYTCEEDETTSGEICCSNCGLFICGSCMLEASDSEDYEDDDDDDEVQEEDGNQSELSSCLYPLDETRRDNGVSM